MSARPLSRSMSPVPRKDPRGRRRPVGYDRAAPLKPIDLETHTQLLDAHKIMSGRCRGYVYWWQNGRLHWRRYVVPRDPSTPTQRRSRAAFGAASKAWSQNQPLTQEQRTAWRAEAATIRSRPRLWQSGSLFAQQYFVKRNSLKERWGLPMLLEPPGRVSQKADSKTQTTRFSAKASRTQQVARTAQGIRPAVAASSPRLSSPGKSCAARSTALRVPAQESPGHRLTPPSSDSGRTATAPLPVQCRWHALSSHRRRSVASPQWSSPRARSRGKSRFRELWRGG